MKRAVCFLAALLAVSGCASQKAYTPSAWPTKPAAMAVRVMPGEAWSRSIALGDVSGLPKVGLISWTPTETMYRDQMVQALGDAGLLASSPNNANFFLNVYFETLKSGEPGGEVARQFVTRYELIDRRSGDIAYTALIDATQDTHDLNALTHSYVKTFMIDFSEAQHLPVYEVLPCSGDTNLYRHKQQIMASAGRYMSLHCS